MHVRKFCAKEPVDWYLFSWVLGTQSKSWLLSIASSRSWLKVYEFNVINLDLSVPNGISLDIVDWPLRYCLNMSIFITKLAMEIHKAILVRTIANGAGRSVWTVIWEVTVFTIDKGIREFDYSLFILWAGYVKRNAKLVVNEHNIAGAHL